MLSPRAAIRPHGASDDELQQFFLGFFQGKKKEPETLLGGELPTARKWVSSPQL